MLFMYLTIKEIYFGTFFYSTYEVKIKKICHKEESLYEVNILNNLELPR